MPDFSHLLAKPAGQATKPTALYATDYPGVVKSFEVGDANKNKTPYVRFHLGITGWGLAVPEAEKFEKTKEGAPTDKAVDPTKRQLRRDFFLTEDALWRLDDFLKSCGVAPDGVSGYEVYLPQVIGANVIVEVQQYINEKTSEIGNQVGKVVGA